ncbi:MAG TPA: hypothetical protein VGI63_01745 [Verrucomicrobiae bacterium]
MAIIDPIWGGHSPTYFVMYWRALTNPARADRPSFKLIGFSPQPEQTRQLLSENGFPEARIWAMKRPARADFPNSMLGDARFALAHWQSLREAVNQAEAGEKTSISFALIIWLDPFLATFAAGILVNFIFRRPWAGLFLQPFTFRIKQSRRWRLLEIFFPRYGPVKAGKCRAVLTLDEGIVTALAVAAKKPVLAMPDVTNTTAPDQNCELAGLIGRRSGGKLVCGLLGVMARRKGILTLIEAAKANPPGWLFVFAGGFSEAEFSPAELNSIREFARSEPANCLFWFQAIPDGALFNAVVDACDVLYANYPAFPYSSGILTKAALLQKPVIVSDRFLIAERTANFNLGWRLPEDNVAALVEFLNRTDRQAVISKKQAARFADYKAEHSEARLNSVLDELIAHIGN